MFGEYVNFDVIISHPFAIQLATQAAADNYFVCENLDIDLGKTLSSVNKHCVKLYLLFVNFTQCYCL